MPAGLLALFTDSSVNTRKGPGGRRARPLCNDVMMSSIWMEEWSVCVYIARLRIHSPASQPRRSADERRSGNQATSPTPSAPRRRGSITAECTVAPSRAASGQKRRRSNALKHTPRTVKDDAHHIFIIVGGT